MIHTICRARARHVLLLMQLPPATSYSGLHVKLSNLLLGSDLALPREYHLEQSYWLPVTHTCHLYVPNGSLARKSRHINRRCHVCHWQCTLLNNRGNQCRGCL